MQQITNTPTTIAQYITEEESRMEKLSKRVYRLSQQLLSCAFFCGGPSIQVMDIGKSLKIQADLQDAQHRLALCEHRILLMRQAPPPRNLGI